MKEWHDAHIEVVTAAAAGGPGRERRGGVRLSPGLQAWKEALDVDIVCSCEEWRPSVGVIWRGGLHFTENKVHVDTLVLYSGCFTVQSFFQQKQLMIFYPGEK